MINTFKNHNYYSVKYYVHFSKWFNFDRIRKTTKYRKHSYVKLQSHISLVFLNSVKLHNTENISINELDGSSKKVKSQQE